MIHYQHNEVGQCWEPSAVQHTIIFSDLQSTKLDEDAKWHDWHIIKAYTLNRNFKFFFPLTI